MGTWPALARETWTAYRRHNGQWLAAALAYFAAFAAAPLILVVVEIAGFFLHGHQRVLDTIYRDLPGPGSGAVREMVTAATARQGYGALTKIVSWVLFVFGALGLFGALQFALNSAWDVPPRALGLWAAIRARAFSFVMVLFVAGLLLLSVLANAVLTAASGHLSHVFAALPALLRIADLALSFAIVWLLFAVLFEYLPDARVDWPDVWVGAAWTALLFVIGQSLLGWYLGRAGLASGYGAFGSLVVFLLWANYSSQIVLFGAEFTHAYAHRRDEPG